MLSTIAGYSATTGDSGYVGKIELVFLILLYLSFWKLMEKCGEDGWRGLIPVYNEYKLFELCRGRGTGWIAFLTFIPLISLIKSYLLADAVAKAFGKGETAFKWGLFFLPMVFYPILGLGSADYYGAMGEGDYRNEDARGATTVNFEVTRNNEDDNTIHFDVK